MCFTTLYGLVQIKLEPAADLPFGRDELHRGALLLHRLAQLLQIHLSFATICKKKQKLRKRFYKENRDHYPDTTSFTKEQCRQSGTYCTFFYNYGLNNNSKITLLQKMDSSSLHTQNTCINYGDIFSINVNLSRNPHSGL